VARLGFVLDESATTRPSKTVPAGHSDRQLTGVTLMVGYT